MALFPVSRGLEGCTPTSDVQEDGQQGLLCGSQRAFGSASRCHPLPWLSPVLNRLGTGQGLHPKAPSACGDKRPLPAPLYGDRGHPKLPRGAGQGPPEGPLLPTPLQEMEMRRERNTEGPGNSSTGLINLSGSSPPLFPPGLGALPALPATLKDTKLFPAPLPRFLSPRNLRKGRDLGQGYLMRMYC